MQTSVPWQLSHHQYYPTYSVHRKLLKEFANYFRGANPLAVDKEGNTPFKPATEPDTAGKETLALNQQIACPQNLIEKWFMGSPCVRDRNLAREQLTMCTGPTLFYRAIDNRREEWKMRLFPFKDSKHRTFKGGTHQCVTNKLTWIQVSPFKKSSGSLHKWIDEILFMK